MASGCEDSDEVSSLDDEEEEGTFSPCPGSPEVSPQAEQQGKRLYACGQRIRKDRRYSLTVNPGIIEDIVEGLNTHSGSSTSSTPRNSQGEASKGRKTPLISRKSATPSYSNSQKTPSPLRRHRHR